MAVRPWHDDYSQDSYKGAAVINDDVAQTLDDFALGHWFDNGRVWSRPEYAYRAARKILPVEYFVLVKIRTKGVIQWAVMMLKQDINKTFTSISAN